MKMIVKTVRKERNFTIVPNEVINDARLSAEARLVHIYLLSRPDNWSAWRTDIMKSCGFGRRRYNRVMSELRNAGYQEFSSGGVGGGAILTVYEVSGCHETRQAQNALGAKRDRIVSTDTLPSTDSLTNSAPKPIEVPDFIDSALWFDFCNHRKEIKKPLTKTSTIGLFKKLSKWDENGTDINSCIRESIENGWQGVFENGRNKKGFTNGSGTRENPVQRREREASEYRATILARQ